MNNAPFDTLMACTGAAACWTLWFYFIKEYRIAAFRERLFSVRDRLLMFAADGHVSFDDPAYLELRILINGMLRFAHRVSFLTLLSSVRGAAPRDERADPYGRWKDSLSNLAPETRKGLEQIHSEVVSAYMRQLIKGSLVLLPLAVILYAGFSLRSRIKGFFAPQELQEVNARISAERDLARTLNAQVLEIEAYREGKACEKLELSLA